MGNVIQIIIIISFAIIGYAASVAGLLLELREMRRGFTYRRHLTRGDVAFSMLLGVVMPVGWFIGLKSLIGLKFDWDAPAFPEREP